MPNEKHFASHTQALYLLCSPQFFTKLCTNTLSQADSSSTVVWNCVKASSLQSNSKPRTRKPGEVLRSSFQKVKGINKHQQSFILFLFFFFFFFISSCIFFIFYSVNRHTVISTQTVLSMLILNFSHRKINGTLPFVSI